MRRRKQLETKVVYVRPTGSTSSAEGKLVKITLVRLPWEPKEEMKEVA